MTIRFLAAAMAALSLAMTGFAHAAIHGRQGVAPPWSFACMTDHGPSECGEPMWIYGD